jgi:A/G-specific adenine glycosylase
MSNTQKIERPRVNSFTSIVLSWYEHHGREFPWRKKSASNYRKIVSEVLLQRTKADVVAKAYHSFFRRFPGWASLSNASIEEIGDQLKPLGLWKRRSETLKNLGVEMDKRHGRFPRGRDEIDDLPGAGQYVANAIELFVLGKPMPLLDVNMARLLERYFGPRQLADIRYDPYLQGLAKEVIESSADPATMNWAILDFAAIVCSKRKPSCSDCPLKKSCRYL